MPYLDNDILVTSGVIRGWFVSQLQLKIIGESPHGWPTIHGKPCIILFLTCFYGH